MLLIAVCACGSGEANRFRLATTTSTYNSGLLEYLLPPFERATGTEVQVLAVGTGQALELGARGDADIVLVHAREREDRFVAEGHGSDRRDVMWNDFVIAGPPDDPAGVRGLTDAVAALRKLKEKRAPFVSRSDDSGTHIRELSLWRSAGGAPRGESFYLEAGQSMGRCLTMAFEKRAYVLTDRGTLLAFRARLDLDVLVEGDPRLRNPYGAMLVDHPDANKEAARKLLDYLTSPEGQKRIGEFKARGQQLFHPAR